MNTLGKLIRPDGGDVDVDVTSHPEFHLSERCAAARTTPCKAGSALSAWRERSCATRRMERAERVKDVVGVSMGDSPARMAGDVRRRVGGMRGKQHLHRRACPESYSKQSRTGNTQQ